jgi:hypothetical protein
MNSTIKPAPPPKPIHLSSAFTSTLDSDALRSYIREQSINTIIRKQEQSNCTLTVRDDDEEEEEGEEGDTIWGTARQRQQTPTKPSYGTLSSLFKSPEAALRSISEATVKSREESRPTRGAIEESTDDVATIRWNKKATEPRSSSPVPGHVRGALNQTSDSSSSMGNERSRQPSILSRISSFTSDDDYDNGRFFSSEQQDTPKKMWMHIKDGSAFERAGPRLTSRKDGTPTKVTSRSSGTHVSNHLQMLAGPPPLRPSSILIDLSAEVEDAVIQDTTKKGKLARALYPFTGEASFNELTFVPGQSFEIMDEDVGGGWSLACLRAGGKEARGLVPRGWYTYVQDFAMLPDLSNQEDINDSFTASVASQALEATFVSASSSSFLSPLASSAFYTSHSRNGSSVLNTKVALRQENDWDITRPASGFGQVYSEQGAALQALTHMQRSSSTPTYIASKSGNTLLRSAIQESNLEDSDASMLSFESEAVPNSTSATSVTEEQTSPKSASIFSSPWKTQALFGGRSLNRYAPFVTSEAEEYILFGKANELAEGDGNDRFDVISGFHGYPSWKHPGIILVTEVDSPEVFTDEAGKDYTAYVVFTSYVLSSEDELDGITSTAQDPYVRPQKAAMTSSVYRRYNQFRWLSTYLSKLFPFLMLSMPPFPGANYGARFDTLFVQKRQRQLQTWLLQVVRHPILSNEEAVRFFLDSEEGEAQWKSSAQKIQQQGPQLRNASTTLFSNTFHPLFNVDVCESEVEVSQMTAFCDAYQKALATTDTGTMPAMKAIRHSTADTSNSYRQLSHSLLRLITGSSQMMAKTIQNATAPLMQLDGKVNLPPMGNVGRRDSTGATNDDRAWCWRDGCKDCKRLTRSLQGTAEALQTVADIYEVHSNGGLFDLHDRIATMAKLNSQHKSSLLEIHKATLQKYRQAMGEGDEGEEKGDKPFAVDAAMEQMGTRCESVVNVTMSEMDRIHTERCQDWNSLNNHFLDQQIEFHQEILSTLQGVKERYQQLEGSSSPDDGPILPSRFEAHMSTPHHSLPLLQPDLAQSSSSYFSVWK